MLHPVGWPNYGPVTELYLAEEAIGLVRSLNWQVCKGPTWDVDGAEQETDDEAEDEVSSKMKELKMELDPDGYARFNKTANKALLKRDKITDGDYVFGPEGV